MNNRFDHFEQIGSKVLCEKNDISDKTSVPQWLDKDKIRRAQSLAKNHFFGVFFAHLSGLILLVHIKSILIPLISTGNSRSVAHLFGRYLRTLVRVKSWYEGDIWDPNHQSHQSVVQVRKMHTKVSKDLNKGKEEMAEEMSLSQFDMTVTQFGA
ncbi:unnamed protein product [Oppiella nova]|uniref:ER-bound oxygenase mpaB/mpaB'/Rubber oxygenase catalytic domain-containing protein n=1 Tax=Oppiella nova TaxID=334625 RepID=A0A7R9LEV7_9ACAR|nr:unnamed protein product [Oppiella nova]CAG2162263.1 unnamed protein product [Oppiella nova]